MRVAILLYAAVSLAASTGCETQAKAESIGSQKAGRSLPSLAGQSFAVVRSVRQGAGSISKEGIAGRISFDSKFATRWERLDGPLTKNTDGTFTTRQTQEQYREQFVKYPFGVLVPTLRIPYKVLSGKTIQMDMSKAQITPEYEAFGNANFLRRIREGEEPAETWELVYNEQALVPGKLKNDPILYPACIYVREELDQAAAAKRSPALSGKTFSVYLYYDRMSFDEKIMTQWWKDGDGKWNALYSAPYHLIGETLRIEVQSAKLTPLGEKRLTTLARTHKAGVLVPELFSFTKGRSLKGCFPDERPYDLDR